MTRPRNSTSTPVSSNTRATCSLDATWCIHTDPCSVLFGFCALRQSYCWLQVHQRIGDIAMFSNRNPSIAGEDCDNTFASDLPSEANIKTMNMIYLLLCYSIDIISIAAKFTSLCKCCIIVMCGIVTFVYSLVIVTYKSRIRYLVLVTQ